MTSKTIIYAGLTIGSLAGSFLGSLLDNGNLLGLWGLMLGFFGGIAGIWAGFKLSR